MAQTFEISTESFIRFQPCQPKTSMEPVASASIEKAKAVIINSTSVKPLLDFFALMLVHRSLAQSFFIAPRVQHYRVARHIGNFDLDIIIIIPIRIGLFRRNYNIRSHGIPID